MKVFGLFFLLAVCFCPYSMAQETNWVRVDLDGDKADPLVWSEVPPGEVRRISIEDGSEYWWSLTVKEGDRYNGKFQVGDDYEVALDSERINHINIGGTKDLNLAGQEGMHEGPVVFRLSNLSRDIPLQFQLHLAKADNDVDRLKKEEGHGYGALGEKGGAPFQKPDDLPSPVSE